MFPRVTIFLLLACMALACRSALAQQPPSPAPAPADRISEMRTDLNQMESLMGNMQSEINFLRDQNLQILLTTNVRMWTILIRDLRRQLDDQERHTTNPAPPAPEPPSPK